MIMADHRRSAVARVTMRGEQHHGIELERGAPILCHIRGGHRLDDPSRLAQQQAAHLFPGACLCILADTGEKPP